MKPTTKPARRARDAQEREDSTLLNQLGALQSQLECAYGQLDYATDEALIDGYIYEIHALHMKYKYFLNLCKDRGVAAPSVSV